MAFLSACCASASGVSGCNPSLSILRIFLPRRHQDGALRLQLAQLSVDRLGHRQRIDHGALALVIVLAQEQLVLGDSLHLHLFFLLLGQLLLQQLRGGHACLFEEDFGLEPSVGDLQLALDLLPNEVQLVDGLAELAADVHVLVKRELLAILLAEVEAVERVLQRERVRNLKLFPGDDATRADFVRLNFEATVLIAEQVGLLREDSRKYSHDCPA